MSCDPPISCGTNHENESLTSCDALMRNCAPLANPSRNVNIVSDGGSSVIGTPSCTSFAVNPFFSQV